MKKYLEAGKIVNTHGTRGEVRIVPWADSAEFLKQFKHFYINEKSYKVEGARVHKQSLVAKFSGIDNINDAMIMKNKVIFIDRSEAKLPKGALFVQCTRAGPTRSGTSTSTPISTTPPTSRRARCEPRPRHRWPGRSNSTWTNSPMRSNSTRQSFAVAR